MRVVRNNPQFAKLWFAQVVSQAGDWLNRIACLVLIGQLGGSAAKLGIGALFGAELALRLLPSALLGPIAGPVADRLPRRLLMVQADLLRAAIVLAFLFVREPGDLWLLYTLIVLQMGVGIFFEAARTAALPDTVARDDLHAAYALSSATWSMMLSIGALAGGWFVRGIGVRGVFVADAASYVGSALFLYGLRLPPVPRQLHAFRWRDLVLMTDLRRGLAHARELGILPILWAKTFWGAAGGYLVLLALAGHDRFGEALEGDANAAAGAIALATGTLYCARGVGTGLGPILARRLFGSGDASLRRQISVGFFVAAIGYALFGFTHRLDLAFACVAFAHLGGSALWVASTIFWQKHVEDAYRGRIFALEFLGMNVAFAVGALVAGAIYDLTRSFSISVWAISALVVALGTAWSSLARGVHIREGTLAPLAVAEEPD